MPSRTALLLLALGCGSTPMTVDAGRDGGARDAGAPDSSAPDSAPADAAPDDAPPVLDAGSDAGPADVGTDAPAPDAGPPVVLRMEGCFHRVDAPDDILRIDFGEAGTAIPHLEVRFRMILGPWRMDVFDRDVLNHNLFGLFRNAPVSRERYLGGLGAQVHPPRAPGLQRTTLFFGRVDLEERPPGMGFMGYTTFRERADWEPGQTYQVVTRWDATARTQVLDVTHAGADFSHVEGRIDYYEVGLTDDGGYLEFGSPETDHRDVSPVGTEFCDLEVRSLP